MRPLELSSDLVPTAACARCGGALDLCTRHLAVEGRAIRAYCSEDCASDLDIEIDVEPPPRRNPLLGRVARMSLGVPMLTLMSGHDPQPERLTPQPAIAVVAAKAVEPPPLGPAWPPTESDWARTLADDVWVHPLDGPVRRMPVSDSRVFGAERPGERPAECASGHCGVDLSGPWGEPVHAAHSGIVDRVQRGANEEHGGEYVRIAHRDGTVFTQYFHLAAIPRRIQPGVAVKAGDVVGLLGDTGVKHSSAHLHFTISVRPSPPVPERYIDPEPLIALWPLRVATEDATTLIEPQAAPGVPRGHVHHAVRKTTATAEDATASAALGE
jgi:hypothetical protein